MTYTNPKRLWRDVAETANPTARREKAKEAVERAGKELTLLRRKEKERQAALASMARHPGSEPAVAPKAKKLRLLALVLLVLDVPVQLLLTRAALPDVELWITVLAATALAGGLAALVHLVTYSFLYDEDRPARAIRLCRWLSGVSVAAVALGATVFLFARQASPEMAGHIMTLTAVALWTVAEALPLAAGFFSTWAHMLAQPKITERKLTAVRARIADHERLMEQLAGELDQPDTVDRAQADLFRRDGRAAVRRATGVGATLLAVLGSFGSLTAQDASDPVCALMVDRTLSMDAGHREAAMRLVSDALPEFPYTLGCRALVVGTFADEGPWSPRRWLGVPERPEPRDCANVEPPALAGTQGILAGLGSFRRHREAEAREACLAEKQDREAAYEREHRRFLTAAQAALRTPQLDEETHTDIVGVTESLLDAGVDLALLVTDGLDTVHDALPALPEEGRVFLILVPASEPYGGRHATVEAARAWEAAGAETIAYTALVARSGWARLAGAAHGLTERRRDR